MSPCDNSDGVSAIIAALRSCSSRDFNLGTRDSGRHVPAPEPHLCLLTEPHDSDDECALALGARVRDRVRVLGRRSNTPALTLSMRRNMEQESAHSLYSLWKRVTTKESSQIQQRLGLGGSRYFQQGLGTGHENGGQDSLLEQVTPKGSW